MSYMQELGIHPDEYQQFEVADPSLAAPDARAKLAATTIAFQVCVNGAANHICYHGNSGGNTDG